MFPTIEVAEGCSDVALHPYEFKEHCHSLGRVAARQHGQREPLGQKGCPKGDDEPAGRSLNRDRPAEENREREQDISEGSPSIEPSKDGRRVSEALAKRQSPPEEGMLDVENLHRPSPPA